MSNGKIVQVAGHGNLRLTTKNSVIKPTNDVEANMYKKIFSNEDIFGSFSKFVPKIFDIDNEKSIGKYTHEITMENLCYFEHKYDRKEYWISSPNIMDIKIGKIQYSPFDSEEKIEKRKKKYSGSFSENIGLRITGFKHTIKNPSSKKELIWIEKKKYGRCLNHDQLINTISIFCSFISPNDKHEKEIFNSNACLSLTYYYKNKIKELLKIIDQDNILEKYFFSKSSLLFIHKFYIKKDIITFDAKVKLIDFSASCSVRKIENIIDNKTDFRESLVNLIKIFETIIEKTKT